MGFRIILLLRVRSHGGLLRRFHCRIAQIKQAKRRF